MVKGSFWSVKIGVFFSFWNWSCEVRDKVVRFHLFQVEVLARNDSDLRHSVVGSVLVHPVYSVATELVFWHVSQDSREGIAFQSVHFGNRLLVVLDEALKVLNGLWPLSIFNKVAHFLLFDLQ